MAGNDLNVFMLNQLNVDWLDKGLTMKRISQSILRGAVARL